jgi:aldose 1-epimerase
MFRKRGFMTHLKKAVAVLIFFMGMASTMVAKTEVSQRSGGKLPDGSDVVIYTLKNEKMEVQVMNYGGYVLSIKVPDKAGKVADVVLGFDDPSGYYQANHAKGNPFFGPIVGRYANRIAHAKFTLDGKEYTLPKNDGDNTLHSGPDGFHSKLWTGQIIPDGVELKYLSKDGDTGFPGNLAVTVKYILTRSDLKIDYSAKTDKPTVLNLTNHSYFNLSGQGNGTILGDELKLNASRFTPVDSALIPTGELKSVAGTPFDFLKTHTVGERINADDEQLHLAHNGYDHNFVLDRKGKGLSEAAEVYDPTTGRVLQVLTTEPGVQFYSANFLDGSIKGKGGVAYPRNAALCLETQHFPDSPNHPAFPTTTLNPGSEFHSVTVFRFSTR